MVANMEKASLIVCLAQQTWVLGEVLKGISEQTSNGLDQIIFCDDGSTDQPMELIGAWSSHVRFDVRYVWQPNIGIGRQARSRNNALRLVRNDIVIVIDGDICISPDFVREHLELHASGNALVCGARYDVLVDDSEIVLPEGGRKHFPSAITPSELLAQRRAFRSSSPWMTCVGANHSFRKSLGILYDESLVGWGSEDREFAYRAYTAGAGIRLMKQANCLHLIRAGHWRLGRPIDVVHFITNKRRLSELYPNGELAESVDLVRYARLNTESDTWELGNTPASCVDVVFAQFEDWLQRRKSRRGELFLGTTSTS